MSHSLSKRALRAILLAGAAGAATLAVTPALAQEAAPAAPAAETERVIVTGTRIRDYTASSPLQTVTGEEIREIGAATIETYLNALPQFKPALSRNNNNPQGGGAATLSLRDLGSTRGLVLVNGRRVVPGDSGGVTDISILPPNLVERVEIITGGASAVYGSDAVAGVVNFILRDNYEGAEVTGQWTMSSEGDAEEKNLNAIFGGAFGNDRGHALLALGYTAREKVGAGARAVSANSRTCFATGCVPAPSPATPEGLAASTLLRGGLAIGGGDIAAFETALDNYFIGLGGTAATSNYNTINELGAGWLGFNRDGSLFGTGVGAANVFNYLGGRTGFEPSAYGYNFQPDNLLLLPFERFSAYASAEYDLGSGIDWWATALFAAYNSETQLAPSPVNFVGAANAVNPNLIPLANLPAALVTVFNNAGFVHNPADTLPNRYPSVQLSRRWNELGGRRGYFDTTAWQFSTGFRGEFNVIPDAAPWAWDVFGTYGEYRLETLFRGYPSISRALAAGRQCTGTVPVGPAPCVGVDLFREGGVSAAALNYVELPYYDNYDLDQTNLLGSITGDLYELPAGWIAFAAGVEYREQFYANIPDQALRAGDVGGANAKQPLSGSFDVYEVFGEIKVPLLSDLPFVHYLGAEGGYRYSDYNTGAGTTETHKYGGEYAPFEWLRFRGLRQKAVRAPSVGELFLARAEGFPGVPGIGLDPCSNNSVQRTTGPNPAAVAALCALQAPAVNFATFVSPGAGQYRTFSGGNPNLEAESAETETYGLVFTTMRDWMPGVLSNIQISVDYWRIDIDKAVGQIGAATSLSRCYDPAFNPAFSPANAFCTNINRDPLSGLLTSVSTGFVTQTNQNLGGIETDGIDFSLNWLLDVATLIGRDNANWGTLGLSYSSTYILNRDTAALPGNQFSESVGLVGDGTPGGASRPRYKSTMGVSYGIDDLQLGWRWFHVSSLRDGGWTAVNNFIPETGEYDSHFFNARYALSETVSVFGGVDNVFDTKPRLFTSGFQYATDPGLYDVVGRTFYLGATAKF